MATDLIETFETSLDGLEVTHERTTPDEFSATIEATIIEPAIGASLPWDDLGLADAPVNLAPTPADLEAAETGVTAAGAAIADYGSVVIESRPEGDEPVSLYPPRQVTVVRADDVLPDLASGMEWLAEAHAAGPPSAVLATGPSSTADMGELVRGVHGPRDVHVVTVTDR